ncbi:hypothetical protein HDR61_01240 [bacterium]|nr:hypothetical protein [bacterium]
MNEKLQLLTEKLKAARSVAIIGHKNPDGDALGAALALYRLIELNYGIAPVCMYDGSIPEPLADIPLRSRMRYFGHLNITEPFDVVILVDYGTARHLEFADSVIKNARFLVEIDHHKNDAPIASLCINDDTAEATTMIIHELMRGLNWEYDADVLNLLAIGMVTDTGTFKFVRTGRVMRIMGDLVDGGVRLRDIYDMLNNQPKKTILVESRAAAGAEFFHRGRLVVAMIPNRDYRNMDGRGENVLDLLARIRGVDYVVLLKEQKENQIGVSLRGRGKPVNQVAEALGGGGHIYAAGAVVRDTMENVRDRVVTLFRGI